MKFIGDKRDVFFVFLFCLPVWAEVCTSKLEDIRGTSTKGRVFERLSSIFVFLF